MEQPIPHTSPQTRILHLFLFSLLGSFLVGMILFLVGILVPSFENTVWFYRLSILLQDILMMLLPAYFVFRAISDRPMRILGIRKSPNIRSELIYGLLILVVSYPAISVLAQWNEQIVLPEALKSVEVWMRNMEESVKQITDLFLSGKSLSDLLMNLLIIAAAAAFVEEIFFRGALQQLLEKWFNSGHLAVWVTALIFSAIHLQFYGFFPRLIMGAILGYLFLYTRNLWVPILFHFVNNALVVVVTFFWEDNNIFEQFENEPITWVRIIIMVVSVLLTFLMFSKYKNTVVKDDSN